MEFIKKNKTMIIVSVIFVILVVLLTATIYSMFNPSNSRGVNDYRLENEVEVDEEIVEKIKEEIMLSDIVNTVSYNKNIRILKFFINVKDDTKVDSVYKLTDSIVNNFSKEILAYYDIEVYVTGNLETYPAIGYRSKSADTFTWVINRGEVSE